MAGIYFSNNQFAEMKCPSASHRRSAPLEVPVLPPHLSFRNALIIWPLFFVICFGLGYPILNRYDPGKVPGTSDAADYCDVVRAPLNISYRVFVPWVAKPFYLLAKGRIVSWDPALFGMLTASSVLTASTAVAIVAIGLRCGFAYTTSLLGAMLFCLDWVVPNLNLSGYVDSGEAFFLVMVIWSMLSDRWYLLPLWAIPGSLSKDTFAPFAVLFAVIWWALERPRNRSKMVWIAGLALLSCGSVLMSLPTPGFAGAASYTLEMRDYTRVGFLAALWRCLKAHEFWFTFVWLLPLGLMRIRRMDRRWVYAAAGTFFLALMMGAYNDALGNTTRALFNIAGPLLSLTAAEFLTSREPHPGRVSPA
jgi:hypothetical protein